MGSQKCLTARVLSVVLGGESVLSAFQVAAKFCSTISVTRVVGDNGGDEDRWQ